MPSRSDLHPYQERAISWIVEKERVGLALEMGLGKSVSTLTAISDLQACRLVKKVLIIAPLRVAQFVWSQECKKWSHLRHLTTSLCLGSERKRLEGLYRTADIYVINRENVPWLVAHYREAWPFDCVVVDESSSFKSPSAQRFKALRNVTKYTNFMVLLTGTPTPKSLLDIWSQQFLIDRGAALGKTFTCFKDRFFETNPYTYSVSPRNGAKDAIHRLLSDRWLSMKAEDYLELPQRIDLYEKVQLPANVLGKYQEFESNLLVSLSDETLEASTAAVLAGKLFQWCNGAIYVDDSKNWTELHTAKLDALAEIIEANEEPILVAYNFRHDLERLIARFPQAVKLDANTETIERWNAGEIQLLLAHPQSAGHGLNLQEGGALAVWFSLNWSLELYQQFNARLHRQGQARPVRIVHLVAEGCLDERIVRTLGEKDATQSALLKALKA